MVWAQAGGGGDLGGGDDAVSDELKRANREVRAGAEGALPDLAGGEKEPQRAADEGAPF